jgi:hypothetical protein
MIDTKLSSSINHRYARKRVAVCAYWGMRWGFTQEQNVARLSYALSQGRHRADVALLYPISTLHANWYAGARFTSSSAEAARATFALAKAVYAHGTDFDFIDEASIARAVVDDRKLNVADVGLFHLPQHLAFQVDRRQASNDRLVLALRRRSLHQEHLQGPVAVQVAQPGVLAFSCLPNRKVVFRPPLSSAGARGSATRRPAGAPAPCAARA